MKDERKQDLVEHAQVGGLIAVAYVVSMQSLATAITAEFIATSAQL